MLQQTRVEAVIPYYERFLERFPSVGALAAAAPDAVLAAWSGLGYYSRARNLHRAAKQLASGALPSTWEQVLALPGVGAYTAGAIASIALGLPQAAVDGNVIRVIARLTNDASDITASAVRQRFSKEAGRLLDRRRPGDFNQAMMELGATVCAPRAPGCGECPVAKYCGARAAGTASQLPVKLKATKVREVALDLAIVERDRCLLLVQRGADEKRLPEFWELPAKKMVQRRRGVKIAQFRHQIVNDRFTVSVWRLGDCDVSVKGGSWVSIQRLNVLPLTTITRKALGLNLRDIEPAAGLGGL